MESSLLKFICIFAVCFMSAAVELLVLPDGVKHSIPCTAPANGSYLINWVVDEEQPGDGFVVGEKETLANGMEIKSITITASNEISNTNLRCSVFDLIEASNSFEPIELTIIIQGWLSTKIIGHNLIFLQVEKSFL